MSDIHRQVAKQCVEKANAAVSQGDGSSTQAWALLSIAHSLIALTWQRQAEPPEPSHQHKWQKVVETRDGVNYGFDRCVACGVRRSQS